MLALPSANSLKRMKQTSFATLAEARKKRKTNRRRFWEEMKTVVLWGGADRAALPKAGKGQRLLGRGAKVHHQAQTDGGKPTVQTQDVFGRQPRGTSIPGDQTAIQLHQGALQAPGEECGPSLHHLGLTNLYLARRHADVRGEIRPPCPERAAPGFKNPENGGERVLRCRIMKNRA